MRNGSRHGNRPGLTLIELLIIIAIVGVLIGALLPAVQHVRAGAQRVDCQNHLRQIGLALHAHQTSVGRLPAGRGVPAPAIFSAHARLLPYLEQASLGLSIDPTAAPATYTVPPATVHDGWRNFTAASTMLPIFVCPADIHHGRVPGSSYGGTNYVACTGSGSNSGLLATADGVFGVGEGIRLEEITDGTSNTVAFSERPLGHGPAAGDTSRAFREIPGSVDPTRTLCRPEIGAWNHGRGDRWIVGNYGSTLYNHAELPNSPEVDCTNATQQKGRMSARGMHGDGLNLLFADGHLKYGLHAPNLELWKAWATRAGGEAGE